MKNGLSTLERLLGAAASIYGLWNLVTGSVYAVASSVLVIAGFCMILHAAYRRGRMLENRVHLLVQRLSKEDRHREVIRWGRCVSRPLWLSGNYESRLVIGEMVLASARAVKDIDAEIKALIDDCGWTLVEMGRWEDASSRLTEGRDLAKKNGKDHLYAKSLRHLSGRELRNDNHDIAKATLAEAETATMALTPCDDTTELTAELHYAKSSLALATGDLKTAFSEIKEAERLYAGLPDKEWQLKIIVRIGDIALRQRQLDVARASYVNAAAMADEFNFKRIKVKARLGIAHVHLARNELQEASKAVREAEEILKGSEMLHEQRQLASIRMEVSEVGRRQHR